MRNVKHLLVAAMSLLSASSMALLQPVTPISEDAPIRITAALKTGLVSRDGVGLGNVGAGLGFAHNAGYDFIWGLAVSGDWASHAGKIFTEAGKSSSSMRLDTELMAAFLPEVADGFYFGGVLGVGFGRQFGENAKAINDHSSFGDLSFRVGPAFSVLFNDVFSMYFNPSFTISNIRFGIKTEAPKTFKDNSNTFGLEAPLGFSFAVSDSANLFIEGNTRFVNLKDFSNSWNEAITLGFSFAI